MFTANPDYKTRRSVGKGDCARAFTSLILFGLVGWSTAQAGNYAIQVGDTISPGMPGPGAGQIDVVTDVDTYAFTATAGQIVYLEELSNAKAFNGYLRWDLKTANNTTLGGGYFDGHDKGRFVLPQAGTYTLTVKVGTTTPSYIGDYSMRVRAVPPDQTFAIQIGDTVADGVPASGAGNIEVPGAQDLYTFQATAGQSAFFEDVSAAPAFKGWLQWEVKAPSGTTVFRSFLDSGIEGRKTFPETGTYTVRVWSGYNDVSYVGPYSFRIRALPPETVVPIQIGQVISDGVPVTGAGRIDLPGEQDFYSFSGVAGQNLFFDQISIDSSFQQWLEWELKAPSGTKVFTAFFTGDVGRKTLPETGTYTLRFWVGNNDVDLLGKYSFKISSLEDSSFALTLGQVVTNGVPGQGAGQIETAGGQDLYSFSGTAGQKIRLNTIYSAPAFAGYLQFQLRGPSSNQVALAFFENNHEYVYVLPDTGTYSVRVFSAVNDAAKIGAYAFRVYSPVVAWPDKFVVVPGKSLLIPKAKFLCNDTGEAGDTLQVLLVNPASAGGGTLVETNDFWRYTPATGFTGQDTFTYQLVGSYGGSDQGSVAVQVMAGADTEASVVSFTRAAATAVSVCLLGEPNQVYLVEKSTDLTQWVQAGTITADASGSMSYQYQTTEGPCGYFRFRKQ